MEDIAHFKEDLRTERSSRWSWDHASSGSLVSSAPATLDRGTGREWEIPGTQGEEGPIAARNGRTSERPNAGFRAIPDVHLASGIGPAWASFRTQLALDRTTLAWVRTTLTMASFGFGDGRVLPLDAGNGGPTQDSIRLYQDAIRMGTVLVLLGIWGAVLAGLSHWLTRYAGSVARWSRRP